MKIKWRRRSPPQASHLKPKPKKRRPSSEEDILHLRRTGRYIPPPRKSWRDKFIVVTKSPFEWLEKRLVEPLANLVDGADVFRILEKVGFLIALLVFLLEVGERREKSIFEAWQVVKDGQGEKSGVVVLALERLKKENFSLSGINVEKTNLIGANLIRANLIRANLSGADLRFANFSNADLGFTNLKDASLMGSNLNNTHLGFANFNGADLSRTNLKNADLNGANLSSSNLIFADLSDAKNIAVEQVKSAKNWRHAKYDREFRAKLGLPPEPMK
ncbi:pentapeptide repeat-containing protein [Nostoc sp. WHI]|uniref:pentapeptide repeat-containing protein n=1 Tax=Nostoc sp. WHI TaxID=2650611 RepID=UPI001E5D19B1|nr:pentapeptide repeat-containing protein [Nostoc sp. WHI]